MTYICKELREGQAVVSCEYPDQARNRGKDVEQGEENDDGNQRDQHIGSHLGARDAINDPENWQR